jgi:hypothetical protein
MITERIALIMLDGNANSMENDPHHTRQFYQSMQKFADVSQQLCNNGNYTKLEKLIRVAFRLFKEGNETVRNAVVNVYLFSLSHALDRNKDARVWIEPFMPRELRIEYARLHYISGV